MATPTNVLTQVVPKLLAQGLLSLREISIMPRLVNSGYSDMAGDKGSTIDVPIPSAITAVAVDHANVAPNPTDAVAPTVASIALDQWYEAPFVLSDKEMLEVMAGTIPMQASAAVRALSNQVDNHILNRWSQVPFVALAKTIATPFDPTTVSASDARTIGMTDVANLRTVLNQDLSPMEDRRVIVDPVAEGNLIQMRAFQDASWSGSVQSILEGKLNRKVGFDWFMTQNLPKSYTSAVAIVTGTGDGVVAVGAAAAVGDKSVTLTTTGTESVVLKKGDIISFSAAGSGYYSVQADVAAITGASGTVTINPGLRVALTTSHTLVYPATGTLGTALAVNTLYKVNLAFHRDAFAFASRPLQGVVDAGLGSIISSATDPISGLSLRLEVRREYKRTRFSYDILWGSQLIRPELAVRYQYT